jgi:hypothetical protein
MYIYIYIYIYMRVCELLYFSYENLLHENQESIFVSNFKKIEAIVRKVISYNPLNID